MTDRERIPIVVAPPQGKNWADMTDAEIDALAAQMAEAMKAPERPQ